MDKKIIHAISDCISVLGGKSDILSILGSYGDTLTDEQVLQELISYRDIALEEKKKELSEIEEFCNR